MNKFSITSKTIRVSSLNGLSPTVIQDTKSSASTRRIGWLIFASIIPVVGLIAQNAVLLSKDVFTINMFNDLEKHIRFSIALGSVIHFIQIQRDSTVMFLNSNFQPEDNAILSKSSSATENQFLEFFESAPAWNSVASAREVHADIQIFKNEVWQRNKNESEVIQFYSTQNDKLIRSMAKTEKATYDDVIWHNMIAYHMLILGKESSSINRAFGIILLTQGSVPSDAYRKFCSSDATCNAFVDKSAYFSSLVQKALAADYFSTPLYATLEAAKGGIYENNSTGSPLSTQTWFANMTQYIDILNNIEKQVHYQTLNIIEDALSDVYKSLSITVTVLTISVFLLPVVPSLVVQMTSKIRSYANTLKGKTLDLNRERKKTEKLLHEILPISVAEKLMKHQPIPPEHYDSVTIYFSDIVGFTTISSKSTPIQVVDMLNIMYNTFDERLERYDVYKVETIGDAYMVASGLPEKNGVAHSAEICLMSLDLLDTTNKIIIPHIRETRIMLRIGVNTGPVVAGVVGTKMPRYCVFGDTVNTSSRMESTGLPNKIQISENTYEALLDHHHGGFKVEERGEIDVKGKGSMKTFFLNGKDANRYPDR